MMSQFNVCSFCTDVQCMPGLIPNISNPAITSRLFMSEGYYLFPLAKFECSGRILGVQGRIYIEEVSNDVYYNDTLMLIMQLWQENQDHYITRGRNYTMSLSTNAEIPDAILNSGLYFFVNSQTVTLTETFMEAIEVEAGDVLGAYLPPTGTFLDNVVINGIPLGIADGPGIGIQAPTPCWTSTQWRFSCRSLLPFTGVPLVSFDFEPSSVMTGKPSDMHFVYSPCHWQLHALW